MQQKQDFGPEGSGRIFSREAVGNQPNWQGDLTLPAELVQHLAQIAASNPGGARLRISAWNKQGPKATYISLSARIDRIQPGDEEPRQYQPRQERQAVPHRGYGPAANRPGRPTQGGHFQTPQQSRQAPEFDDDIPWTEPRRR